jgi:hypothetical protein
MTEEQRKELEELILEFEQAAKQQHHNSWSREQREKAYDRITDHLDLIQWDAALYNFRRSNVEGGQK